MHQCPICSNREIDRTQGEKGGNLTVKVEYEIQYYRKSAVTRDGLGWVTVKGSTRDTPYERWEYDNFWFNSRQVKRIIAEDILE